MIPNWAKLGRVRAPFTVTGVLLATLASGCATAEPPDEPGPEQHQSALVSGATAEQHLLLTVEFKGNNPRILDSRTVPEPLPVLKNPVASPWQVLVKDAAGRILYTADVPRPNVLRGEFKGKAVGAPLDSVQKQLEDFVVPLRIPLLADAVSIELSAKPGTVLVPANARAVAAANGRLRVFEISYPAVQP